MTMPDQGAATQSAMQVPGEPASADRPIRVMIVDDSAVVRGLVSRWIGEEPGLEVVACHANGRLAVEDVAASAPDIVVLDRKS
jgi:two-component system chemotaxis response regulator CheB